MRVVRPISLGAGAAIVLHAALAAGPAAGQTPADGDAPFPIAPPDPFVTEIETSEDTHDVAQDSITSTFVAGVRRFDWTAAADSLAPGFRARFPGPHDGTPVEDDRLHIRRYAPDRLPVLDRDRFLETLRAHADAWTSMERASWHTFEFLLHPDRTRAFARAHMEMGGPGPEGQRSVLNATVAVELVRASGPDRWQIARLDLEEGVRVENPRPPFRDITDAVGLHFNRSAANWQLRQEILDTRASLIDSGLNVVDWDQDGFWDIVATESWDHSVLFRNDGRGGFVREEVSFSDRRLIPSQVLVVDLDNDGMTELVTNRVVYQDDRAWMAVHTRRGDEWTVLPRALMFETEPGVEDTDALSMTAGDVNGDGLVDLFFAGYETNQSRDATRFNRVDADDGSDNLLFMNQGGLRFSEESDARGITGTQYTFVSQFFDFDEDGDLDLLEGNDYGRNVVWDNQGDGTFRALPDHPLARDANYTMGVTIGDWDNTGEWSVYVSNMYSHAGNRVVTVAESTMSEDMLARIRLLADGNQFFVPDTGNGALADAARPLAVNDGGWAWGCVFYDLDNDGDRDIFVANGNTSFSDPEAPDF